MEKHLISVNRETRLIKNNPILGTVVEGEYAGLKFSFFSLDELKKYFTYSEVYGVLRGNPKITRGCTFCRCTVEEALLHQGKFTDKIAKNINVFKPRFKPIIGTVVKGPLKGFRFSFFSTKELTTYFNPGNVHRNIKKEIPSTLSCTFEHASEKEALPFQGNFTNEIYQILKCKTKPLLGEIMEGPYKGLRFGFTSIKDGGEFFGVRNMYRIWHEEITVFNGCQFKKVTLNEALLYQNNLTRSILTMTKEHNKKFTPIIGTVQKTRYKGLQFSFLSLEELTQFFQFNRVLHVLNGKGNTHKRCTFQYATEEEALKYQGRMTQTIYDLITGKSKHRY